MHLDHGKKEHGTNENQAKELADCLWKREW